VIVGGNTGRRLLGLVGALLLPGLLTIAWAQAATAQEAAPATAGKVDNSVCLGCHDQGEKVAKSAHASVACASCHQKHDDYPHPAGTAKPVCGNCHKDEQKDYSGGVHGQARAKGDASAPDCGVCHGAAHEVAVISSAEARKGIPDTCAMCHDSVVAEFKKSVHGKAVERGVPQAPICNDCHGEHSILSPKNASSMVNAAHVRDTCARCHADVRLASRFGLPADRVASFDDSFHGLAARSGSQTVANCSSCHGIHNILPSADPNSMVSSKNLAATCGRCHQNAGSRFAVGTIHWSDNQKEPLSVQWARWFYLGVIPATIGLMLLHNAGDWVRKLYKLRFSKSALSGAYPGGHAREFRMGPFERLQHLGLLTSFSTLVWTGFALKYPDNWWARPLLAWEGTYPVRGVLHRSAAVVMILVSVAHVISLIMNRKLREHWLDLLPNRNDISESLNNVLFNLGLRKTRTLLSQHSYIEKAEYWAVVWGSFVMIATGALLWANTWALHYLPKSWLDLMTTVHFYEAVLASLAIVVWHFYFVLLDPEVYPMDPAWLTGYSLRRRRAHHHKGEAPAGAAKAGAAGDSGEAKASRTAPAGD
jgi:cytochrome b subunit of formate dehydrogenase